MRFPAIRSSEFAWPKLAEYAAHSNARPEIVQMRASDYHPMLDGLSDVHARRLVGAVEDVLAGQSQAVSHLVPRHSSEPFWVPSMLTEGFAWPRWRDPVDGFEPYEDKLGEWGALGAGERSEDFLFTAVMAVKGNASLDRKLAAQGREHGEFGVGTGYGPITLTFDPRTLANATILSGVTVPGLYGTRAGTIEHLPALLASRIVASTTHHWASIERYRRLHNPQISDYGLVEGRRIVDAYTSQIERDLDHRDPTVRASAVEKLIADPLRLGGNAVEAHVRGLTPGDVIRVDVEPPIVRTLPKLLPNGGTVNGRSMRIPTKVPGHRTRVSGLVDRGQLREIERAARTVSVPTGGFVRQREVWDAADALRVAHPRSIITKVHRIEPPASTAQGTSNLRRQMRAAREAAASADS